jgi:hypothetical protein
VTAVDWNVDRMRPVVREWDKALRAELPAYARLVPTAEARESVLREPASEDEIAAAEERLGVRLPPSYRSFLLLSDGAEATVFGAAMVLRLFGRRGGGFVGVRELVPLSTAVSYLVPGWRDAMGEFADRQEEPSPEASVQVFDFAPGENAVLITVPQQDEIVALVPFQREWQVWEFAHTEVHAYESFAAFIRHKTRAAQGRVTERNARVEAAVADGRSFTELEDLAAQGDPRAVAVACRGLEHSRRVQAALQLIYLGDPTAIPALWAALERCRREHPFTPTAKTERRNFEFFLLKALDSCGDPDIERELQRTASEGPRDIAHLAAQHLDTRRDAPRW